MGIWVLVALAAGLALRLYFALELPRLAGDTLLYGDIAKNLIQHHVYGFTVTGAAPRPTLIRVPGYPLFLALCFLIFGMENYQAVLYLQTVIDLCTCLLVADLARRLFGRRAGLAALWLACLCPFTANYVAAALTETLSLFCIALAFYALERWRSRGLGFNRWLWTIAAALAYAILLRPEQGLLAAAILPAMLWMAWRSPIAHPSRSRAVSPILIAALCLVLPLLPWAIRNRRTFHVFQPLAPRYANDPGERVPLGFQRWYRTWAIDFASTEAVYWNWDGDDISIADIPTRAFDSQSEYASVDQILAEYDKTDRATAAFDQQFDALAQERIARDPVRYYLALPIARLADMLLRPRLEMMAIPLEWWKWHQHPAQTAFGLAYAALNIAYLVLGAIGFRRFRRSQPVLAWSTVAFVALRCALLLTLDNSEPRYTLEFFPILCLWAAALFTRKEPLSCTI
jgi:4-amino-4-deoxy-L-arabinose transferase-like glycosyltransferase